MSDKKPDLKFTERKHGDVLTIDRQPQGGALIQIGFQFSDEMGWYSIRVPRRVVARMVELLKEGP